MALEAASRMVDDFTGRRFYQDGAVAARTYTATSGSLVDVDDVASTTGLLVETDADGDGAFETAWTSSEYFLLPINAAAEGRPWNAVGTTLFSAKTFPTGVRQVRVTARYGWASVPATVKQATLIQAARLFARKNSPYGVAGSPEMGSELRLLSQLDVDVQALLRPLRRVWSVVV